MEFQTVVPSHLKLVHTMCPWQRAGSSGDKTGETGGGGAGGGKIPGAQTG